MAELASWDEVFDAVEKSKSGKQSSSPPPKPKSEPESWDDVDAAIKEVESGFSPEYLKELKAAEAVAQIGIDSAPLGVQEWGAAAALPPEYRRAALERSAELFKERGPMKGAGNIKRTAVAVAQGGVDWGMPAASFFAPKELQLDGDQEAFRQALISVREGSDPSLSEGSIASTIQQAARMAVPMVGMGVAGRASGTMAKSVGLGAVGTRIAQGVGVTAAAYPMAVDQSYRTMIAEGLDPEVAAPISRISGLFEGAIESAMPDPFKVQAGVLKGSIRRIVAEGVRRAGVQAGRIGIEASEEGAQAFTREAMYEVARAIDEDIPNQGLGQAFVAAAEEGLQSIGPLTVVMGPSITLGALGTARNTASRPEQYRQAIERRDFERFRRELTNAPDAPSQVPTDTESAERLSQLQEIRSKGFVSINDASNLNIEGKNRKDRLANLDKEIEALKNPSPWNDEFLAAENARLAAEQGQPPSTPTADPATLEQSPLPSTLPTGTATQPGATLPGGEAGAAVAGIGKGLVEGLYTSMYERLQSGQYPGIAKNPSDDAVAAEHARQPFQTPEEIRQFINDGSRPIQEQPSPSEVTQEEAAKLMQERIAQRRAGQSQATAPVPQQPKGGDPTVTDAEQVPPSKPRPTGLPPLKPGYARVVHIGRPGQEESFKGGLDYSGVGMLQSTARAYSNENEAEYSSEDPRFKAGTAYVYDVPESEMRQHGIPRTAPGKIPGSYYVGSVPPSTATPAVDAQSKGTATVDRASLLKRKQRIEEELSGALYDEADDPLYKELNDIRDKLDRGEPNATSGGWVSMPDAAKFLGISEADLTAARSAQSVFAYRDGASWKFKVDELKRYAEDLDSDVISKETQSTPTGATVDPVSELDQAEDELAGLLGETTGEDVQASGDAQELPQPKHPDEVDALPKDSLYRTTAGGKKFIAVRGEGKRGGGDRLFETVEAANAHIERQKVIDQQNEDVRKKREEREAEESKKEADYVASFQGFKQDNPREFGRARKVLDTQRNYRDKVQTRKQIIEQSVADGAKVLDGRLERPDGTSLGEDAITKIGIQYAEHLIAARLRSDAAKADLRGDSEMSEALNRQADKLSNPESKWQSETRAKLDAVPALKGSKFDMDEKVGRVNVTRPDGLKATIHFNSDEELAKAAVAKGRKPETIHGRAVRRSETEFDIYVRSDANHTNILNHEVMHWLEFNGVVTKEEVEKYGGREAIAEKYGKWAEVKLRKKDSVFQKIYDALEAVFSSQRKFFEEVGESLSQDKKPSAETAKGGKPKTSTIVDKTPSVPSYRDWRFNSTARNAGKIVPNKVGAKFLPDQMQAISDWAKSEGYSVSNVLPTGININDPSGNRLDIASAGAAGVKAEASKAASERRQANERKADEDRKAKADGRKSAAWIANVFGSDAMNDYNRNALSDYLEGDTKKFEGMVSEKWREGLKSLKALSEEGKIDWKRVLDAYDLDSKNAPAQSSADQVNVDSGEESKPSEPSEPLPELPIPKFTRTTPDKGSTTRQDQSGRVEKARAEISDLERKARAKRGEHDGLRSNATKKRAAVRKDIEFLNRRIQVVQGEIAADLASDTTAKLEDELESPRSYDHYLAGMKAIHKLKASVAEDAARRGEMGREAARSVVSKEEREADRLDAELQGRAKDIAMSKGFTSGDAEQIALAASNGFTVFEDRSLADVVEVQGKRTRESRVSQEISKLKPSSPYGQKDLSNDQVEDFTKQYQEASLDDKNWLAKRGEVDKAVKEAINANREASRKREDEERKAKEAEKAKDEHERLANARERAKKYFLDERISKALKKQKPKTKTVKIRQESVGGPVKIVEGKTIDGDQDGELYPNGLILHKTFEEDSKDFVLTHARSGSGFPFSAKKSDMQELIGLLDILGLDFNVDTDEKGALPSELTSRVKKINTAWDNGDYATLSEQDYATVKSLAEVAKTDIDADLILTADDLGANGIPPGLDKVFTDRGLRVVKGMAEEVPEFAYDPVFTVKDGMLLYRDGYEFNIDPTAFNLHPSELKEGQTVGINLEDLGIKRATPQDVVAEVMKGTEIPRVTKTKGGAVSVGYVGARPTTLQQGESDNDWSVVGGTQKVQEIAIAALKKIRWRQPGQDGDPKTDIDVVPVEKESVVAKKESESDIVTPLDPVKRIENVIEQGRATGREPSKAMLEKLDDAKEETNSPMDSLPENGYIEGPKGGKLSKPQFEVGERVQVGNSQGVVESVNLRWSGTGPKGSAYKDSYKVRFDSGDLANAGSLSMDGNDMKKAASVEPVTETPKPIPAEVEFMEMSVGVNAPGVKQTIRVTAGERTLLMERSKHDGEWSIREAEKYTGEVKGKTAVKKGGELIVSGIVETKKAKEIAQRIIDGTFDKDADKRFVREDTQSIGLTNAGLAESMKGALGGKRDSFAKLLREQGLVTEGRILMKVNDKDRDAILKGVGETDEGRSLDAVSKMMTDGQKALSRSANAMKPIGYRGGYLTPRTVVLQSQDGDAAIIDKSLHDTILKKYPNAVPYFLEDGKPISYVIDGDLVAIVMPMNMDKPDAKVKDLVAGKYDFEAEAAEAAKFPPPQAKSKLKKAAEQADSDKNLAGQIKAASESLRNQSGDTDVLYQKTNVDPQVVVQATDLAIDAQDAGIESFDELVAFSVKTVGEQRTRDLGQYLAAAGDMLGLKGVRPVGDVIGMPGVTREQAMVLAKAAFPMLTDEQIEAGLDIQDATAFGRDQVGFAPFGTPAPGMSQSQRDKGDVKGWTQFISAARAIIGATGKADVSTFIHELFHPMRKFLLDRNIPAESRSGITDEDIKALEDYAGAKDGKWTVESEEKAAKAWEQYWYEGKSPTTALRSLFEKLARWMREVYRGVHQITGGQLPPEVRQLFDKIIQRGGISEQEMPQDDNLTSIKNEVMNDLRAQRGLPELADVAAQTQQEWIDTAESRMRAEPGIADRLVKAINANPRNLSNIEVAILQLHYRHVNNELASVSDRLFDAKDAGDALEAAKVQREVDLVMNALAEIEDASKAAGREWGRAGVSRQIVLRKDFSLAGIMRKARIANAGNALSAEQQAEMIDLAKQIAELQGQLAKSEQEKLDLERQQRVNQSLEEEKKRTPAPRRSTARTKAVAAVSAFKQKFADIFTSKESNILNQTEEERMAEEAMAVVEAYVKAGVFSFGEFMANVKRDIGADLPIKARVAFSTAWANASMSGDIPTPGVDPSDLAGITRLARKIQRSLVEAGITEREAVVDGVHESLQEIVPDITRRETMDALSGYGQYTKLSQAEDDKIIRDINGQLQQLAKLDDMRSGQAPSKTGGERRTPSDEERRLIKEVNEAKRRGGFVVTDPQAQLKTAMEAAKTAVRNRIADITYELTPKPDGTYSRIVRSKTELIPDAELEQLRKRRDALLDVHKTLFPKPGATMEQRIAAANRAIDASIADLEEQLKTGNVMPKGRKVPVSTPELDAKRARLAALQEQRDAIRALANPKMTPEERADKAYKASLLKRLADYQERMVNSEFDAKPKKEVRVLTPEQLQLKKQLEDVKDQFFQKAAEYRLAHMSPVEKAWDYVKETSHLSRAIMTSFDLSAVFRQGGVGSLAHPVLAAETSREMWNAMKSSQAEFDIAEGIRNDPMYQFAMTAKLAITEEDGKITRQEEAFMGRWARHGIGKTGSKVNVISQKALTPIAMSARAYTTFLNGMRFKLFKLMVNNLGANGQVTADEAKVIAQYVNVATGRADLGKYNQAMANLNVLFFAPRYVASRFQFFALPFYLLPQKNVSLRVKKQITMEYARYATGLGIFLGTAAALGSLLFDDDDDDKPTVELDPRSSDFGKIRIGETRIDPMSGFSQVVAVVSQVLTGRKKGADGEIQHLRGEGRKWGSPTTWNVMSDFARKKFAPIPSAVFNVIVGENVVGEEVTPLTATRDLFIPLSVSEVKETMQARGVPAGSAITILTLLGMGGGTYGPKTKFANGTEEERKTQLENDLKKMEWDSPDLPYRDLLNEEQYDQMNDRREERKQDLAYAATALPVHNKGQSKESFEKEVAAHQEAIDAVLKAGWTEEFVRQLLRDYAKTRGNKEAVVDRIRRIRRIFSTQGK